MTGRPDYDAGDLVVCLEDGQGVRKGDIYRAAEVFPFLWWSELLWVVRLEGMEYAAGKVGHPAKFYRKVPPKLPEFWTKDIPADLDEPLETVVL